MRLVILTVTVMYARKKVCRKQSALVKQSHGVCISMGTETSTLYSLLSVYVALLICQTHRKLLSLWFPVFRI